jgi:hypothetical protein
MGNSNEITTSDQLRARTRAIRALITNREFLAIDLPELAPLSWAERATVESGRQITCQRYREFVAVTAVEDSCQFCSHIAGDDTYMRKPICECCLTARETD